MSVGRWPLYFAQLAPEVLWLMRVVVNGGFSALFYKQSWQGCHVLCMIHSICGRKFAGMLFFLMFLA